MMAFTYAGRSETGTQAAALVEPAELRDRVVLFRRRTRKSHAGRATNRGCAQP